MADETLVATIKADLTAFQASMRQMVGEVQRASQQSTQAMSGIDRGMQQITTTAKSMGAAIGIGFSVTAVVQFGKAVVQSALQMDTLKRSIDAAAGSVQAGAQQMEFLRATSQRLGLDLATTTKGYAGFLAATTAAGKSTAVAQEIFQNFAAASTVAGHSAETFSGIMLAVTQIMAKGTFSAEELRGQLAERLPQAVGALATSLGLTTEQLNKMLEGTTRITSDALIPMSQQLVKMAGGTEGVAKASTSATSEINRFKSAITEANNALGESGLLGLLASVTKALTGTLQASVAEVARLFKLLQTGTADFRAELSTLLEIWRTFGPNLEASTLALRTLTNSLLITTFTVTKAADGFRLLWHSITGDWEAAKKVVDEMTDRTKTFLRTMADVNQADPSVPFIKLNPILITAKKNTEDVTKGLKLFTSEATDGAKTRQKALDDELQANTKYAADMIARYATLEEAQEAGERPAPRRRTRHDGQVSGDPGRGVGGRPGR